MKKRMGAALVMIAVLLTAGGCGDEETQQLPAASSTVESSLSQPEKTEKIHPVSSSLTSPLGLEEWGSAGKFSTAEQKYYPVPIRIMSVRSDASCEQTVRDFLQKESLTYQPPEKGCRWVIAEYEICLDDFPADQSGTDASVTSLVTGTDGKAVTDGDHFYVVTTVNITDGAYYYEGIHKAKIAFAVPAQLQDYTIALGEYGETQAFFSQSKQTGFSLG